MSDSALTGHLLVTFMGDTNCGKSSIINHNKLSSIKHTIAPEYHILNPNDQLKLALLDLPGDFTYVKTIANFYQHSDAYVIVVDSSNTKSIKRINHWYQYIKSINIETPIFLILTKCDLKYIESSDLVIHYNILHDFTAIFHYSKNYTSDCITPIINYILTNSFDTKIKSCIIL